MSEPVSRYEFGMLQRQVAEIARRVDGIDTNGSRGLIGLVEKTNQILRDLGAINKRLDRHEREHREELQTRTMSRRWKFTAGLSAAAVAVAMIGLLVTILAQLPA